MGILRILTEKSLPAEKFFHHVTKAGFQHINDPGHKERKCVVKTYELQDEETEELADPLTPPPTTYVQSSIQEIVNDLAPRCRWTKNLVFVNSRRTAEALCMGLQEKAKQENWYATKFDIHHGSLSKEHREDVELALGESKTPITVVCSSTLEMGINFKGIVSVAQIDPIWTVFSLCQRMGRCGREEGQPSILRQYAPVEMSTELLPSLQFSLLRCIASVELMVDNWLEPSQFSHRNLSTLVFQILSVLRETGGCNQAKIYDLLCANGAFSGISKTEYALLIHHLLATDILEGTGDDLLILTPAAERITHDQSFYAAFAADVNYTLRHDSEVIGELPSHAIPTPGQLIILAARRWQVQEVDHPRKTIWAIPARRGNIPRFSGSPSSIHNVVVGKIREILFSDTPFPYLSGPAADHLTAARRSANIHNLTKISLVRQGSITYWFPWVGTDVLSTLVLLATASGLNAAAEEFCLSFVDKPETIVLWAASMRELASWDHLLANPPDSLLHVEKYDTMVPKSLLMTTVLNDRLDLPAARVALESPFGGCSMK